MRALANVDLGSWDEGEAVGPEHSPLHRIDVDQALVDRPEVLAVEVLGQGQPVEAHALAHPNHTGDRAGIEREVLGDLGVGMGVHSLQRMPSALGWSAIIHDVEAIRAIDCPDCTTLRVSHTQIWWQSCYRTVNIVLLNDSRVLLPVAGASGAW